jgi:hypothetical protein
MESLKTNYWNVFRAFSSALTFLVPALTFTHQTRDILSAAGFACCLKRLHFNHKSHHAAERLSIT